MNQTIAEFPKNVMEKFVVISVIGPHAGENEEEIFDRKINDIKASGITFWLIKSYRAKPDMVQAICSHAKKEGGNVRCIFIEPSSTGGSIPTKTSNFAQMFSSDMMKWSEFLIGISPVTGKIDGNAYALVFNELKLEYGVIDLWNYADFFNPLKPLKIMQGASTLCAIRKNMSKIPSQEKIKSRFRRIVAVGKLCSPYGVWLRIRGTSVNK